MDIKFKTCVMKLFSIAFLLYMQMEIYSYFKEDSGYVIFSCNEMGILSDDLNNINLKDTNYKEDVLKLLFISDFWLDIFILKHLNAKHLKES